MAIGHPHLIWVAFAKYYEKNGTNHVEIHQIADALPGDLTQARAVFDRSVEVNYRHVDDLAAVWCEYAEMEIRAKYVADMT